MKLDITRKIATPLFLLLCLIITSSAFAQSVEIKSELRPNKIYRSTQVQTLEGFDGTKDINTLETSQAFKIETGKLKNGTFSAKLTAYASVKGTAAKEKNVQSIITFTVGSDGSLSNFEQVKGEGTVAPKVAGLIASQNLEGILLHSKHKLDRPIKRKYTVKKTSGTGSIIKVSLTYKDISPNPVDTPNMTTSKTGTATYDTKSAMFTSSKTVQRNRIIVPEEPTGPAKEVRMTTTTTHRTKITSR